MSDAKRDLRDWDLTTLRMCLAGAEAKDVVIRSYSERIVRGKRPAAVLVPIIKGDDSAILLTRRAAHLSQHAGQVSFPGGRIEDVDGSPEAAALREAKEEIGLDPMDVEIIGRLPKHTVRSGYIITPVVGLISSDLSFQPSPEEVSALFTLPLAVLLDPDAPRRQRMKSSVDGTWIETWLWPHPEHVIWGATAAILMALARCLRGEA